VTVESAELAELYVLIRTFEGCKLVPYLCPAGVWTCGWGSTGPDVVPGQAWTQDYADRRMRMDAIRFARGTLGLCPGIAGTRLCAISDFAYNLGLGNLQASTLRRKVNAGEWEEAKAQLMRWVRGGGRVLPGLVRRRKAEADLI
jgi:lysozyme